MCDEGRPRSGVRPSLLFIAPRLIRACYNSQPRDYSVGAVSKMFVMVHPKSGSPKKNWTIGSNMFWLCPKGCHDLFFFFRFQDHCFTIRMFNVQSNQSEGRFVLQLTGLLLGCPWKLVSNLVSWFFTYSRDVSNLLVKIIHYFCPGSPRPLK